MRGRAVPLPPLWITGLVFASMLLAAQQVAAFFLIPGLFSEAVDLETFRHAGDLITSGQSPYIESVYRWHPLLAYPFALPITTGAWLVVHLAVTGLLRDWRPIAVVLTSWPFWFEVDVGNAMIFPAVAGYLALRGHRSAEVAWFALAVMIPRPLVIPLTAWLLWQRPHTRPMFAVILGLGIVSSWPYGGEWLVRLTESGGDIGNFWNLSPSRFIGAWWLAIGIPLGAWLTYRGKVGWAGLAISPYVLPYYGLLLLAELRKRRSW